MAEAVQCGSHYPRRNFAFGVCPSIQLASEELPQPHSRANAIGYIVFTSGLPDGVSLADET